MAKKTIVVTPAVAAVTKDVLVGPGYLPIYFSPFAGAWRDNRSSNEIKAFTLHDTPMSGYEANGGGYTRGQLYIPVGVSAETALADFNALANKKV